MSLWCNRVFLLASKSSPLRLVVVFASKHCSSKYSHWSTFLIRVFSWLILCYWMEHQEWSLKLYLSEPATISFDYGTKSWPPHFWFFSILVDFYPWYSVDCQKDADYLSPFYLIELMRFHLVRCCNGGHVHHPQSWFTHLKAGHWCPWFQTSHFYTHPFRKGKSKGLEEK